MDSIESFKYTRKPINLGPSCIQLLFLSSLEMASQLSSIHTRAGQECFCHGTEEIFAFPSDLKEHHKRTILEHVEVPNF